MSDTLSLATRLRALDDAALATVLRARRVKVIGVKDFFDLAEALLDRSSIQNQLMRLDRGVLAVIAAAGQLGDGATETDVAALLSANDPSSNAPSADDTVADDPTHDDTGTPDSHDARPHDTAAPAPLAELRARIATAASLLLLEVDGVHVAAYTTVAEQMASWPAFGLPGLAQLADSQFPAALGPVSAVDVRFIDRIASERAFTSTSEITELLAELEREPAHELARGGLALPDAKRLAHAMSVDLDSVRRLLEVAERAGLAAREAGSWLITDAGCEWLLDSSADRWRALVAGWLSALPADIRTLLGERSHALWGDGFGSFVEWLYPAGGEWIHERVATYTEAAELLGITANQAPSGPGILLFSKGPDAAAAAMATLLPREVEQVYLQHDLSIVAPGPLTPRVDNRLRSLADVEGRALASSYRVSTSSLNRALAAGETAESVQEFLGAISLTGIPQPLAYLIAEASRRYGLLRVGDIAAAGGSDARSYVTSPDEHLLTTVLVDQNLSTLGLRQVGSNRLESRFAVDVVFWTLSDARYPVAAETPEGDIRSLRRLRHARAVQRTGSDHVLELIERLRLGSETAPEDSGEAWLARQLDAAIRSKAAITVTVMMPNGSTVNYQLEPTSLASGRLRGKDRRADIERTLPLASVVGIGPAE